MSPFIKYKFKIIRFNVLLAFLVVGFSAYSQTYTSIANGNWNNTTTVWSTDGVTPCSCAPSSTVNGFDVVVDNNITLTSNIDIDNAGNSILVNAGATIDGVGSYNIDVKDGTLNSNGTIDVLSFEVKASGIAISDGPLTADTKFSIEGSFSIDSLLTILNANLESKSGAMVAFDPSAVLDIQNGNISVVGTLNFNSSCVQISNGTMTIDAAGSVTGSGWVNLVNGAINNSGSWALGVNWCASGASSGMPNAEDCGVGACSAALPIDLISFEANINEDRVDLKWVTSSEINNDFFTIERSVDAKTWEVIMEIDGAGNSNQFLEYFDTDHEPLNGISYYRLKQTDYNGEFSYSAIVPVKYEVNTEGAINLFPSPLSAGETLNVEFENIFDSELLVVLRDIQGREFYSKVIINIEGGKLIGVPLDMEIPSGIYLITATSENQMYSQKLIIKPSIEN